MKKVLFEQNQRKEKQNIFFLFRLRKSLSSWSTLLGFRILARGVSAVVTFHNRENMAKGGGLCVANHTSPIDAILLACDRNYALVCIFLRHYFKFCYFYL